MNRFRFRGNDIKGNRNEIGSGGNDPSEARLLGASIKGSWNTKEGCPFDSIGVLQYAPTIHQKTSK